SVYTRLGKRQSRGRSLPPHPPIKRMVQKAKETGTAIDATQGRKTKAVLVMENNQIVLSALLPETISGRAQMEGGEADET
ncbi:MAG: DUF370 domain-containing protein, partial [Lachnospiraceae bacterium]|nr:DUF370 domain-containing protein [Lachnospiraceae bacterium]